MIHILSLNFSFTFSPRSCHQSITPFVKILKFFITPNLNLSILKVLSQTIQFLLLKPYKTQLSSLSNDLHIEHLITLANSIKFYDHYLRMRDVNYRLIDENDRFLQREEVTRIRFHITV